MIGRTVGAAVLALLWMSLGSDPAAGQPDAPEDDAKARAQALVDRAFDRIKASDHEGALGLFRQAYEVFPSEKILLNIGTSLARLGRDAEAAQAYRRYLNHPEGRDRREQVAAELARLEGRVARLRIETSEPGARVEVDGTLVQGSEAGATTAYAEPGTRTVTAEKAGFRAARAEIVAVAGSERTIRLTLVPEPKASVDPVEPEPPADPSREPVVRVERSVDVGTHTEAGRLPWIVVGSGAAVTAAGAGLLTWALVDRSAVEKPDPGTTWPELESRHDRVKPLSTAGFIAIGVGVAAMAGGLTWALLDGRGEVTAGPGAVAVQGTF